MAQEFKFEHYKAPDALLNAKAKPIRPADGVFCGFILTVNSNTSVNQAVSPEERDIIVQKLARFNQALKHRLRQGELTKRVGRKPKDPLKTPYVPPNLEYYHYEIEAGGKSLIHSHANIETRGTGCMIDLAGIRQYSKEKVFGFKFQPYINVRFYKDNRQRINDYLKKQQRVGQDDKAPDVKKPKIPNCHIKRFIVDDED